MVASPGSKRLEILPLSIPDVRSIIALRHSDARGFFAETFNRRDLAAAGIDFDGIQDNRVFSGMKGTVRGLHFQIPPFAQAKLVRAARGSILDLVVDIRRGSPSYGRHVSIVLSARDEGQIFIPAGFAHGYCTLEPDTEVLYKVDRYYSAQHDRGIRWDDPDLAIDWPVSARDALLSERDRGLPGFRELESPFVFDGDSGARTR